jgi:hypothetical protein
VLFRSGNLRTVKSGPNAGQPNPQYFIAVAFSKTDPAWPAFRAQLDAVAKANFPLLFPDAGGPFPSVGGGTLTCTHPAFAWKIVDGDGYDTSGKSNAAKEGFAGQWVVRFTSGFPPKVYPLGRHSPMDQITAEHSHMVRRGYYVRIYTGVEGNGDSAKPGLYMNLNMLELCGTGTEIVGGANAAEAFAAPVALPAGATPLPGGPTPPPTVTPPVTPVAPPPVVVVVAPPPAPSAPPATRMMTAAANGLTFEQYLAAGWSEAQMIAGGLLVV